MVGDHVWYKCSMSMSKRWGEGSWNWVHLEPKFHAVQNLCQGFRYLHEDVNLEVVEAGSVCGKGEVGVVQWVEAVANDLLPWIIAVDKELVLLINEHDGQGGDLHCDHILGDCCLSSSDSTLTEHPKSLDDAACGEGRVQDGRTHIVHRKTCKLFGRLHPGDGCWIRDWVLPLASHLDNGSLALGTAHVRVEGRAGRTWRWRWRMLAEGQCTQPRDDSECRMVTARTSRVLQHNNQQPDHEQTVTDCVLLYTQTKWQHFITRKKQTTHSWSKPPQQHITMPCHAMLPPTSDSEQPSACETSVTGQERSYQWWKLHSRKNELHLLTKEFAMFSCLGTGEWNPANKFALACESMCVCVYTTTCMYMYVHVCKYAYACLRVESANEMKYLWVNTAPFNLIMVATALSEAILS